VRWRVLVRRPDCNSGDQPPVLSPNREQNTRTLLNATGLARCCASQQGTGACSQRRNLWGNEALIQKSMGRDLTAMKIVEERAIGRPNRIALTGRRREVEGEERRLLRPEAAPIVAW
jgi:hypothetical protein